MINLQTEYGQRYKVTLDEMWNADRNKKNEDKPWYYEIRGKLGIAYIHNDTHISLELTPRTWKKWKKHPPSAYILKRLCDEGPTLLIKNENVNAALKVIKPRHKRTLTPEQRSKAVARLQKYHFKPAAQND